MPKVLPLRASVALVRVVVAHEAVVFLTAPAGEEHVEDGGMSRARQAFELPKGRKGDLRLSPCRARESEPPRQRVVHGEFLIGTPDVKPDTS
jgi:hypothetical protein